MASKLYIARKRTLFINKFAALLFTFFIVSACAQAHTADPSFETENFKFENYKTQEELAQTLQRMFPVGTDREYIEFILIDQAGSSKKSVESNLDKECEKDSCSFLGAGKLNMGTYTRYYKDISLVPPCRALVRVYYSGDNKTIKPVKVSAGCNVP